MSKKQQVACHVSQHFMHPRLGLNSVLSARQERIQTPMQLFYAKLAFWANILGRGSRFVPAAISEHILQDRHQVCVPYATWARIKLGYA